MSDPTHDLGDRRKLTCEIRDETDALVDPTGLTFSMREPDATLTDYTLTDTADLVRDSLGVYHVYWDCAQVGKHYYRFAATGNVGAAEEAGFKVRPSRVIVTP
jgi:hypothetical protein